MDAATTIPAFTIRAKIAHFRPRGFVSWEAAFLGSPGGSYGRAVPAVWAPRYGQSLDVVLKIMIGRTAEGGGDTTRDGFENEVDVLQQAPPGAPLFFIAMEPLAGGTLWDRLRAAGGPLPRDAALRAAADLLAALAALHALGFAHADLKGDNILFDAPGPGARLRVIDYNCARLASGAPLSSSSGAKGAQLWRAPELPRGDDESRNANTPASDMWSAGLVLYETLTGGLAYYPPRVAGGKVVKDPVDDWADRVKAGRSPEDVIPLTAGASTPAALVGIVRACLQRDPGARITAEAAHGWLCSMRLLREGGGAPHAAALEEALSRERAAAAAAVEEAVSRERAAAAAALEEASRRESAVVAAAVEQAVRREKAGAATAVEEATRRERATAAAALDAERSQAARLQARITALEADLVRAASPHIRTPHVHSPACNHAPAPAGAVFAAAKAGDVSALHAGLKPRGSTEEADEDGDTALIWAARRGHLEAIRALLAAGANPAAAARDGWVPLHAAAASGHAAIVRLFLATPGVDPTLEDGEGGTPLDYALERGETAAATLLQADPRVAAMLAAAGRHA